jgi:pilus assembly protein FimV
MFAATPNATADSLDMELHGAAGTLDLDISGMPETATDIDLGEGDDTAAIDRTGIDFVLDDTMETPRPSDSQVAPTIEMTFEIPRSGGTTDGDTQELTVDNLGLDVDSVRDLDALSEDTIESPRGRQVEDTVEMAVAGRNANPPQAGEDEPDLLSSTSILDATALMENEGMADLSDATGKMPLVEDDEPETSATTVSKRLDFDLGGEPPTMSEVGTKLDLARAYMDMGDPEGARSILDEVVQEGSSVQRQEAERLIASLP